jgi:hypothetical protein
MAKKLTFNCATGELEEVEMVGDELAAHEAMLAEANSPPPPSRDERLLTAVGRAKAIVASGGFTETQAQKLAAVFDGLAGAISG